MKASIMEALSSAHRFILFDRTPVYELEPSVPVTPAPAPRRGQSEEGGRTRGRGDRGDRRAQLSDISSAAGPPPGSWLMTARSASPLDRATCQMVGADKP
ncbi:unnamed protein product [Musa acuminata var. zebrina]